MFTEFTRHLYRGGAFAYYHVLPQRRSLWYDVSDPPELDPAFAKTNLYFSVHPTTMIPPCNAYGEIAPPERVRSQVRTIAAINCLFAEFDAKDYGSKAAMIDHLDALTTPTPSVLVDSGAGLHAYWLLTEPYLLDSDARRGAARTIQDRWVGLVGGDSGVKDLTRILRVPGSWNYKYQPRRDVDWLFCDLDRLYTIQALTAHLPPIREELPRVQLPPAKASASIRDYNQQTPIDALLERYGYQRRGRYRMVSPHSGSKRDGVSVDADGNRAFVHTGGDPLCDGYWKRPFDVLKILECDGDFKKALSKIRAGA